MFLFKSTLKKKEDTKNRAWADYDTAREAARKSGLPKDMITSETILVQANLADEDHRHTRDQQWLQKMDRFELAVPHRPSGPDPNETWEQGLTNQWLLTEKGFNDIRTAVREEQKQRREPRITYLTLTIGLTGAITGLIAVLATIF